jgi:hypothetical protein
LKKFPHLLCTPIIDFSARSENMTTPD